MVELGLMQVAPLPLRHVLAEQLADFIRCRGKALEQDFVSCRSLIGAESLVGFLEIIDNGREAAIANDGASRLRRCCGNRC
jgi:hypothetical protein